MNTPVTRPTTTDVITPNPHRKEDTVTLNHVPPTRGHRSGRSRGPAGFIAHHLGRYLARRAQRDYEASVVAFASGLRSEFREGCTGLGLCQYVSVAAGLTVRTPRVGEVRVGPPLSFTVELLPGQEGSDFTRKENAPRLAHTLGGHGLRVEPVAGRWVRLVVLDGDPLAVVPTEVVDAVGGRSSAERGVGSVEVVAVQPGR